MCVGFWSLEHLDYALYAAPWKFPRKKKDATEVLFCSILCTNRDEYLSRATENAHFHSFGHGQEGSASDHFVLSGLDLQAGGSWFGTNRSGKVALLSVCTQYNISLNALRLLLANMLRIGFC